MKSLVVLAAVLILVSSCKKDKICDTDDLPCQTHEGKNTFGCYINGKTFVANTSFSIGGATAVSGQFDESQNLLQLQGSREDSNDEIESVKFHIYIEQEVGTYTMWANTDSYKGYTYSNNSAVCTYYHDMNNKGSVTITFLDTEKNIIAGTFEMTLINPDCTPSSMVITNGRFDFGY